MHLFASFQTIAPFQMLPLIHILPQKHVRVKRYLLARSDWALAVAVHFAHCWRFAIEIAIVWAGAIIPA